MNCAGLSFISQHCGQGNQLPDLHNIYTLKTKTSVTATNRVNFENDKTEKLNIIKTW